MQGWLSAKKDDLAYAVGVFQDGFLIILKLHLIASKTMGIEAAFAPVVAPISYEELECVDRGRDELFPSGFIVFKHFLCNC